MRKKQAENIISSLEKIIDYITGENIVKTKIVKTVECDKNERVKIIAEVSEEYSSNDIFLLEAKIKICLQEMENIVPSDISILISKHGNNDEHAHPKMVPPDLAGMFTPVKGVKSIIAVASGKGGVGKSATSYALALTLSKMGKRVGIVDADIYGPSIPAISKTSGIKMDVIDGNFIPVKADGISISSLGYLVNDKIATIWRGPMASKAIWQLIRQTEWGDIDVLIVDMPPGTGDIHLSILQKFPIDGIVMVSTPSEVAIIDTFKALYMFKKMGIPVIGMIENMAYLKNGVEIINLMGDSNIINERCKEEDIQLLGKVPFITMFTENISDHLKNNPELQAIYKDLITASLGITR